MAPCYADSMEPICEAGFGDSAEQLSEPSPTSQSSTTSADSPLENHTSALFLRHAVTKLDTLAGIAIKYGVSVSDIKRVNGLISDSAMFARSTLLIPRKQIPVDEDMTVWLGMIVSGYGKTAGMSPGSKPTKDHLQMMGFDKQGDSKALNALNDFYGINETGNVLDQARHQAEADVQRRSAARNGNVEVELMNLPGTEGFAGARHGPKLDERLLRRRGTSEDEVCAAGDTAARVPETWASPFAAFGSGAGGSSAAGLPSSAFGGMPAGTAPRKESFLDKIRRAASQPILAGNSGGRSRFTAAAEALVSGGSGRNSAVASGPVGLMPRSATKKSD